MERYCPPGIARFVPANKISPKFKRVQESFLSQNIFYDSKKFSVIYLSGWNQKTRKPKRVITFACNWLPFQCSKIKKYEDHFFSALYAI